MAKRMLSLLLTMLMMLAMLPVSAMADEAEQPQEEVKQEEQSCLHEESLASYVPGEEGHTVIVSCVCGELVEQYDEKCVDEEKDSVCDYCLKALESEPEEEEPAAEIKEETPETEVNEEEPVAEVEEETQRLLGDVNADNVIDEEDAKYVLQYVCRLVDSIEAEYADVDGNGKITVADATIILRYATDLIDSFPAEQN